MRTPRLALFGVCLFSVLAGAAPARAAEPPPPAVDLSGNWSGFWESCTNSHRGPLHARFCRLDDTHYRVVFRGRFFGVVPFRYTATLTVVGQQGDRVLLSGSSYLGPLVGTFSYNAQATACDFVANYCSRDDHGRFVLRRCGS